MQSPIETLKENLMKAYMFEAYTISSILTNDGRPPAHDNISDQAVIYVRDAIIQSQKLMKCLLILERSSEFRDFVTRMDTRTPQLTQPGFFSSPKNIKQEQPQIPEAFKKFFMLFMSNKDLNLPYMNDDIHVLNLPNDDQHPHNFNLKGLLDSDRPNEKYSYADRNFKLS